MVSPTFTSVITDDSLLVLEELISDLVSNRHSTRVQSTDHASLSLGYHSGSSDFGSHETVVNAVVRARSVFSIVGCGSQSCKTSGLSGVGPSFVVPSSLASVSAAAVGTV